MDSRFGRLILRRLAFPIACCFKAVHPGSVQIFAVFFLSKMVWHDVTKTQFSLIILDGFFCNFNGRRQINGAEGTKSFTLISAVVFFSYRENLAGGEESLTLPPARGGLKRSEKVKGLERLHQKTWSRFKRMNCKWMHAYIVYQKRVEI